MAIMGFGFAALLTCPVAQFLMSSVGLSNTFYILGAGYFLIMIVSAQFIKRPTAEDLANFKSEDKEAVSLTGGLQMTANQALKAKTFYLLWFMFFISITCGISLVSAASPMAQELTGMSAATAAVMVGIIGLFNGFGRLVWATLSDYIGRPLTYSLIFVVDMAMFVILIFTHSPFIFAVALSLLMSCYGAGFSVIPAYLGDVFGTKELGAIHGSILTAWAAARHGWPAPALLHPRSFEELLRDLGRLHHPGRPGPLRLFLVQRDLPSCPTCWTN